MNAPRPPFSRKSARGGAAVELLLSVPFLFIFALATLDFVRGARSVAGAHRAARQIAWSAARHGEDSSYPDVPSGEEARAAHFYDLTTEVTVAAGTEDQDNPVSSGVSTVFKLFSLEDFGRGVVSFLTGKVALDTGTASQPVSLIRLFPKSTVSATHKVSLRSRPEATPEDPEGWWDPFFHDPLKTLVDLFN